MVELGEDCLHIIFGFLTPIDWIRISEVCRLWKTVVRRQWQQFEKFDVCDYNLCRRFGQKPIITLSAGDAEEFVRNAAECCKHLSICTTENGEIAFTAEKSYYLLCGLKFNRLLRLVGENATEIEVADFLMCPKLETLKLLFKKNKIKDLKMFGCMYEFWLHVPTDGIESLLVTFKNLNDIESFEGHFPNLKKLDLGLLTDFRVHYFQRILQRTLPYVVGIKSLVLSVEALTLPDLTSEDVKQLPDLEELSFKFYQRNMLEQYDLHAKFDKTFDAQTFSKLRVLKIERFRVPDKVLRSMLLLPNLERLEVNKSVQGLHFLNQVPKMNKLSVFAIEFEKSGANMTNLHNAFKNMPNLEVLCVKGMSITQFLTASDKGISLVELQKKRRKVVLEVLDEDEDSYEKFETVMELKGKTEDEQGTLPALHLRFESFS